MKSDAFIFDRLIYDLLMQSGRELFTTRELRNAYAQHLEGNSFNSSDLRRYLYEQIRRMLRAGWAVLEGKRLKRGQVYRLLPLPQHLQLKLVDKGFDGGLPSACKPQSCSAEPMAQSPALPNADVAVRLESLQKEIRLDFLSSMGEAERYKQLTEDMPNLKSRLEKEFSEARDRSSRLLGHLRAVEHAIRTLTSAS